MSDHKDKPPVPLWFIVNMRSRWQEDVITRGWKPTKLHRSLASAYAEAARMASLHQKGDYAVFECIGRCVSVKEKPKAANPAATGT